ncbi:hypothetical protein JR316_0010559 [Psilocybe cubensis]|uniref:Uncharacterized protein n=2 Tax=Psilocybe cubensis TaxID=181762 RepID=A0A8H8CDG6_PSICU|nr:hypothetical protein JR316_0010559 [Psilocybe cubensis]KAH9476646.1 hypothetical protein JR316_0010559 [Psilocybe cubensis]
MPKARKSKSSRSLRETVLSRQAGLAPKPAQPAPRSNHSAPVAGSSNLRTQPVFTAERTGAWTDCFAHGITFVEGCEDCEFHRSVVVRMQRNNDYIKSIGGTEEFIELLKRMTSES